MTERKFFVTNCPQCRGKKIGNVDWPETNKYRNSYNSPEFCLTIGGADKIPCPTCDARGKVIAQVVAPFVEEETW